MYGCLKLFEYTKWYVVTVRMWFMIHVIWCKKRAEASQKKTNQRPRPQRVDPTGFPTFSVRPWTLAGVTFLHPTAMNCGCVFLWDDGNWWHLSKNKREECLAGFPDPLLQVIFMCGHFYVWWRCLLSTVHTTSSVTSTTHDLSRFQAFETRAETYPHHWNEAKKGISGIKINPKSEKNTKRSRSLNSKIPEFLPRRSFWSWGPVDIFARPRRGTVQWTFLEHPAVFDGFGDRPADHPFKK